MKIKYYERSMLIKHFLKCLAIALVLGLCLGGCDKAPVKESLLSNSFNPVVKIETTFGHIFIELFQDKSPLSVANFLEYVSKDFYDQTIFHRVQNGFVIQGGKLDTSLKRKKVRQPIKNEATNGLENKRGTIAFARDKGIDTATSEFFINVVDNIYLDHRANVAEQFGYAVFGQVIRGMNVIDKIKKVKTHAITQEGWRHMPVDPIIITNIIVIHNQ